MAEKVQKKGGGKGWDEKRACFLSPPKRKDGGRHGSAKKQRKRKDMRGFQLGANVRGGPSKEEGRIIY